MVFWRKKHEHGKIIRSSLDTLHTNNLRILHEKLAILKTIELALKEEESRKSIHEHQLIQLKESFDGIDRVFIGLAEDKQDYFPKSKILRGKEEFKNYVLKWHGKRMIWELKYSGCQNSFSHQLCRSELEEKETIVIIRTQQGFIFGTYIAFNGKVGNSKKRRNYVFTLQNPFNVQQSFVEMEGVSHVSPGPWISNHDFLLPIDCFANDSSIGSDCFQLEHHLHLFTNTGSKFKVGKIEFFQVK